MRQPIDADEWETISLVLLGSSFAQFAPMLLEQLGLSHSVATGTAFLVLSLGSFAAAFKSRCGPPGREQILSDDLRATRKKLEEAELLLEAYGASSRLTASKPRSPAP